MREAYLRTTLFTNMQVQKNVAEIAAVFYSQI